MAIFGTGVPGWHPLIFDYFLNGICPTSRVAIRSEREGRHRAGMMATGTVFVQQSSDVLGVSDGPLSRCTFHSSDIATLDLGDRPSDRLSRQQFLQCSRQVAARWVGTRIADPILIVDPPVIADDPFVVQDEDLRRTPRIELIGERVSLVF